MTDSTTAALDALSSGLRGEFAKVSDHRLASPHSANVLARAHYDMLRELARMVVPRIGTNDDPQDFEAVADYLLRVCQMVDRHIQAIGEEVKANALCQVDMRQFEHVTVNAISGNATYEIECAIEAATEAYDEEATRDYDAREDW